MHLDGLGESFVRIFRPTKKETRVTLNKQKRSDKIQFACLTLVAKRFLSYGKQNKAKYGNFKSKDVTKNCKTSLNFKT